MPRPFSPHLDYRWILSVTSILWLSIVLAAPSMFPAIWISRRRSKKPSPISSP